jgi:hypothetical protein
MSGNIEDTDINDFENVLSINLKGLYYTVKEIIPCMYDKVERFREGSKVALVSKDGLWGLINQKGKPVTPIKFNLLHDNKDGTFQVRDGADEYIINEAGKRVEK